MTPPTVRPAPSRRRRFVPAAVSSTLAVTLLAGASPLAGCSSDATAHSEPAALEAVAQTALALSVASFSDAGGLFAVAGNQLEQGSVGGTFTPAGDAYGVTALAGFHGQIYVASNDALWQRGAIGPNTGNDWTRVGSASGAVAMTYHQGALYMVAQNQLWQRSAVGPGSDWALVGDANNVTAMASFNGKLYVASGNALWQRGAIGPGTGNDWTYAGDAYGVTAMAAAGGHLYVVSNGGLWQRGAIGPGTGNDWTSAGAASGVTALTSLPVSCTAGFSAADCPAPNADLTGLTDVAVGHAVTQSSTAASGALAVDGDITTASSTNVEANPWLSVDFGFDRSVQALAIDTDTPGLTLDLLDASGNLVVSESLSAFTSARGMYVLGIPAATARTLRVHASGSSALHVFEVQAFAPVIPAGMFPLAQHTPKEGACWKSTYGRGVGTPISACDPGQDQNGALCYPQCAAGYYGVGPVCWQSCPAGWTDTGAFCHRDGSIIGADTSSCPWYDTCGLTLARGCSSCPPGYADDGCTCRIDPADFAKGSYGRGAGVPLHCTSSQEEQAGLCYTPCSSGYDGVGPVCWGECSGDYSYACGSLACASDANACTSFISSAVDSTTNFAINVAALVATWGEAAGPLSEIHTITNTLTTDAVEALTKQIANQLIAASQGTSAVGSGGTVGQQLTQAAANSTAGAIVTAIQTGTINWTLIDPTGIAAVIAAFNQPTC